MFRRIASHRFASALVVAALCSTSIVAQYTGTDNQSQTQLQQRPVIKYTVASPRACLIGPPPWSTNAWYLPSGDAENFPRANGSIRLPVGARVVFCLSREIEGVWYSRSYGLLGTQLVVQWCRYCTCGEPGCEDCICSTCTCEQCRNLCAECLDLNAPAIEPCPWVTVGRDGARDVRKGPSIGRAKVGVPVSFRHPGVFYLRAIVRTVAAPYYTRPIQSWRDMLLDDPTDADAVLPRIPLAEDIDVIYLRVRVVDLPIAQIEPEEGQTTDPDIECITPMPKDVDPNAPVTDPAADLNGDERVNIGDLVILSQQWGAEYEMPFTDDE